VSESKFNEMYRADKCPKCGGKRYDTGLYTTECSECGYTIVVDFGFNDNQFYGGGF